MNINIQGEPKNGKVLMQVYIDEDDTPNSAQIDLWVEYSDSMASLRQNTIKELTAFLKQSLESSKQLNVD